MSEYIAENADRPWAAAGRGSGRVRRGAAPGRARRARRAPAWLEDARVTVVGLGLAAMIAAGMMLESSALTMLPSVAALAAALISPVTGLVVLTFTAPLPRPDSIPTPGLHLAMIAAILMGLVFRLPLRRRKFSTPSAASLLALAFLLYTTAHFAGAVLDGYASADTYQISRLYSQMLTVLLAFVVARLALNGQSPRPILAAALATAVLVAGVGIAQSAGTEQIFGLLAANDRIGPRVAGPHGDPNYYGTYLGISVTLAIALLTITRSMWGRLSLLAIGAFVGTALLLTQSRGAMVTVVAGLIAVVFMRSRKAGVAVALAVVIIGAIGYPIFSEWRFGEAEERASLGFNANADSSGRVEAVLASRDLITSSPIFGIGYGRFADVASTNNAAHNWYTNVFAEMGVIGAAIWGLFILAIFLALRHRPPWARMIGYSVMAAWMVGSLFLELPMDYQSSGPVLIVLAAACVAEWPSESAPTVPTGTAGITALEPGPVERQVQPRLLPQRTRTRAR